MNHTPGPWEARRTPESSDFQYKIRATGNTVARIDYQTGKAAAEANARLIAAAPDLLTALVELCEAVGYHPDSMTDGAPLNAAFVKAAAVVNKALPTPPQLRNAVEVPLPLL